MSGPIMSAQLAADVEAIMTCSVAQVASEIEPEEMTMEELKNLNLPKGKYAGKQFEKVWNEDMNYVKWTAAHLKKEGAWKHWITYIEKKVKEEKAKKPIVKSKAKPAKPSKTDGYKKMQREADMVQLEVEQEDEDWDEVSGHGFIDEMNYQNKVQMDQMMEMFSQMCQRMEHLETITTQVIQHMEKGHK